MTFLKEIGYASADVTENDFVCMELCQAIVKFIPEPFRPPSSDLACRVGFEGGEPDVVCDVDLSPSKLAALDFDIEAHDFHAGHPTDNEEQDEQLAEAEALTTTASPDDLGEEMSPEQLLLRLANRFRIYPMLDIEVSEDVGEVELWDGTDISDSFLEANGTDSSCSPHCSTVADCFEAVEECHGCIGCRQNYGSESSLVDLQRWPFGRRRKRKHQQELEEQLQQEQQNMTTAVTTLTPDAKHAWVKSVEEVNIKAQAYVARALLVVPKARKYLQKWFGDDDQKTIREVMRVLNSLSTTLGNVAYKKGFECRPNSIAYVWPTGPKARNTKGEFKFYLCPKFFRSSEGEKIEALTHEGTHHAVSYTEDVCMDLFCSYRAYGREICRKLARARPKDAIRNADNHCYFINDVIGHKRPRSGLI